jgi:hypothetical protein
VPAAALALMPKCPACVAAYAMAGTGIAVSVAAAAWLRAGVIVMCVASIALMALTTVRRHLIRKEK